MRAGFFSPFLQGSCGGLLREQNGKPNCPFFPYVAWSAVNLVGFLTSTVFPVSVVAGHKEARAKADGPA
jgi:hypothetical protein